MTAFKLCWPDSLLAATPTSQHCPDALKGLKQILLKSTEKSYSSEQHPEGLIFSSLQTVLVWETGTCI